MANNAIHRFLRGVALPALLAASSVALGSCGTVAGPSGNYVRAIGSAPVTSNPTPYSPALVCLSEYARKYNLNSPRIAVGRIADYTGKEESDGSGRKVTQGASLMAMTAFGKAGARLVERFDTSVSELELKYANNKLISDGDPAPPNGPVDYRKIMAGQVPGSDFYLVGGITELNFNIQSSGANAYVAAIKATDPKGSLGGRIFVMNIAMDLRLVDTRSLEVVDVISYQKQIVAREVTAGFFDILNGNIFDLSAGTGALEPIQLAVRAMLERSVVEMMANLYGMPSPQSCLQTDPLGPGSRTTGLTGAFTPAYNNVATNNAQTREDPSRWNANRDPNVSAALRGRY